VKQETIVTVHKRYVLLPRVESPLSASRSAESEVKK